MSPSHPVTVALAPPDHDSQEQEAVLQIFLVTVHHYFGSLSQLFAPLTDPLAALLVTGLLK